MARQAGLFDDDAGAGEDRQASRATAVHDRFAQALDETHAEARRLANLLPPALHFGTSSWSFPGWAGLVYGARHTATVLAREGLREYARHPLLTTVGIDRSYYAPLPVEDLRRYAEQLPDGFRCCIKAPASVTASSLGGPGRWEHNPDFLSPQRLIEDLLQPCEVAFAAHTGPIVIECPAAPRELHAEPGAFVERLDRCLEQLPTSFAYAVEVRERRLLTAEYADTLRRHGASHVYSYWSGLPLPGVQAGVVAPDAGTNADLVLRLLMRPGARYEARRDEFQPFNRLVEPDMAMRQDVVAVIRRALAARKRVHVIVNNKAEGSSPLTIAALAALMAENGSGVAAASRRDLR